MVVWSFLGAATPSSQYEREAVKAEEAAVAARDPEIRRKWQELADGWRSLVRDAQTREGRRPY